MENHRHLWHDELYTFYIAQAPSLSTVFEDLRLDLNPPLLYLLSRAAMKVFGDTSFAVRFPSMLAFFGGSLCLYALVRSRLQSSVYGSLAVLVFWSTAFYFAVEARPYALILGFFAMAMLAWWRAHETQRSSWTVVALAVAVSGMMLSHFFAILFLAPFLLAEAACFVRSRRIDRAILAALLSPCVLPFFFLRLHTGEAFPAAFRAGTRKMGSYYYWVLREPGWLLFVGFFAAVLIYRLKTHRPPGRPNYSATEISFVACLFALPVVINAALMLIDGAFFTRYSIPTLLAIPILFVALLAPWTNTNRYPAVALCAMLAVYTLWHEAIHIPPHSDFSHIHPELPIVAASGLTFLEMDHEEPPITVNRLYYLTDRALALTYAHATLFEGLPLIKQHLPIRGHVEPFQTFAHDHHTFLVLGTPNYPEDWLLRYLLAAHAKLQLLGKFPSEYKDSQLFLVEL